jgi:O-antigen/teichoic acid export membrane protein
LRKHLSNAGYGILDYISYPAGMWLVAPVVLHEAGAAEYGLWMFVTSVISAGGIIASGFGDACIQRVAFLRGNGEFNRMPGTVRSMLGINLLLGVTLGAGVWLAAPFAASRIAVSKLVPAEECLICLRIAAFAIVMRALESVAVGAQRAFQEYGGTVRISTALRLLTLATAAALALIGFRTPGILVATALFLAFGAAAQFRQLARLMPPTVFWPRFETGETRLLLRQGFFVWLQALGGVVFGQLDRIFLGIALGALAVTPYAVCVQFAHPLYGLTASGLNFFFPYLSSQRGNTSKSALTRSVGKVFLCNLILVGLGACILLLFGNHLVRIWAGAAVAQSTAGILPPIVIGSALMGLGVTGTYAMQALGEFRTVALISLAGRAAMVVLMIEVLRHHGLEGLALSRLGYGAVALLIYLPLVQKLHSGWIRSHRTAITIPIEAREASRL